MHLPEDAGGHAARLWKFLDEMSERDPEAYAEFLEKQAVNAGAVSRKRGRCCGYRNHRIINRMNEKKMLDALSSTSGVRIYVPLVSADVAIAHG